MIFVFLFALLTFALGGLGIYRWARKSWQAAEVEQKLADDAVESELYDKIKYQEPSEQKEKHQKIEDFLDNKTGEE